MSQVYYLVLVGAQWLSGRVLYSRPRGRGFEPHQRHCVVSLSKNINPSLVLVQPRKTHPFITVRLLMGRKESNQTKQNLVLATSLMWHVSFKHPIPLDGDSATIRKFGQNDTNRSRNGKSAVEAPMS